MNTPTTTQTSWLKKLKNYFYIQPESRQDLVTLLNKASENGLIGHEALHMIEGVLQVSEVQVREVMVPRSQMVVVQGDATPESIIPILVESAHSRFPVIGENRDEVLGVLLAKEVLRIVSKTHAADLHIKDLVRPATFIPESKRLNVLLKEFRINRNHMAIVVDEYGGIAGLVTIEDVLEQIVGEIEDEYDLAEEPTIQKINENECIVKAIIPIEEFNQYFGTDYLSEDYETLGGLVLHRFSHLPKRGESITIDNLKITVIQTSARGILLLRVTKLAKKEE